MKNLKNLLFLVAACIMTVPALSEPVQAEKALKIGGTGDGLGLMRLCAQPFAKRHPHIKVDVLPSLGSNGGIKAVASGTIDIGLSAMPLKIEEQAAGLQELPYARLPFVFVANAGVPASDITLREIAEIYEGKKLHWANGQRIRLILRPENDSDSTMLKTLSPNLGGILKEALSRTGMIFAVTGQENADIMEKTAGAFGISTLQLILTEKRNVKILSFNGRKAVQNGTAVQSYPLFKQLHLVTRAREDEPVRLFLDFLLSAAGQKIMYRSGVLPMENR